MSTASTCREFRARGFPPPGHPAEPDLFCRQAAMPGHNQERLSTAHVVVIGCGGLGSWVALGLARMGIGRLTLVDPDYFDRTNAPRQLMFASDMGQPKAHALAANIIEHMTNPGQVNAVVADGEDVVGALDESPDAVLVGVDNNAARLDASRWARARGVPVVFAMLSRDGLRAQVFRQDPQGACLSCVLPNLDPEEKAPCAAASIASCYLAAAHGVQMVVDALMGASNAPTWRETSLDGSTERMASPSRRAGCRVCSD